MGASADELLQDSVVGVNNDQTEFQSASDQSASQKLSMQATTPPAEVPGYRLQQFLGAGAFGQVWVGRDLNTGRDVAVKFYLHRGGVNWSLLSREVKNLVQLSADRYVVQVLEVGWDADPPYYVMELITGGSLEDMLQKRHRLTVTEAVDMFRKMCIGLNRCHAKGVLHCDIKPANILLGDDHEPRIADFGQSRLSNDQTPALGTLFYMAPEQADLNSTPDASWDVYALGAIMYRMLTGDPPYRNDHIIKQVDTAGSLHKRLEQVDPLSAAKLHPHDKRRIIRALEVYKLTGQPISHQQVHFDESAPADSCNVFVLSWPRADLHRRIEERVETMFAAGLESEVASLLERYSTLSRTASQAVGYREVIDYLNGAATLPATVA